MMLGPARDLYGLPPAEFTAARNQLAKQLKAGGAADDAKAVAGLRRPKVAEYALNRLARTDADLIRRFADAVVSAQRAQAAAIGGDTGALREATATLRHVNAAVVDAAVRTLSDDGGNGETQRDEIVGLLREFVGGASTAPLVAGVIGSEALITADELFPGAPEPPPARARSATRTAGKAAPAERTTRTPSTVARPAPAEPPARPPREPSAAAKATAAAKQAMRRAEHTRLREAVRASEAAVAKAADAVAAAQAQLAERRGALKTAEAEARAAAKALAAFTAD